MKTAVLFVLFNRPDTTRRVFEAIREAKPPRLYIAADGPRRGNADDEKNCREVRAVVESIDWDCQVSRRFLDENAGCCKAVSSAISWFFDNEEEGIILEDDCLPHPSFFLFCETLLERYRNNISIMHIAGANHQFGKKYGKSSYYFSTFPHIWGWATWRRAWKKYDLSLSSFQEFRKEPNRAQHGVSRITECFWLCIFTEIYYNRNPTTWDHQWFYSIFRNHGICAIPQSNLISNIGFGDSAVHMLNKNDKNSRIPLEDIGEVVHPETIEISKEADMKIVLGDEPEHFSNLAISMRILIFKIRIALMPYGITGRSLLKSFRKIKQAIWAKN